jgi:hypothetical protein
MGLYRISSNLYAPYDWRRDDNTSECLLVTGSYGVALIKGTFTVVQIHVEKLDESMLTIKRDRHRITMFQNVCSNTSSKMKRDAAYKELQTAYNCRFIISAEKERLTNDEIFLQLFKTKEEAEARLKELTKEDQLFFINNIVFYLGYKEESAIGGFNMQWICRYQNHPDCCGAVLLYRWISEEYPDLPANAAGLIRKGFDMFDGAAKLVHLAQYQEAAATLLEEIGFEVICEYKNIKSNNGIKIFQLEGDASLFGYDDDDDYDDDYDDDDY